MLAKLTWEASTVEKLSFLQLPINTRGFVSGFQQTRLPFNYTLQFVYVIVLLLFKKKKAVSNLWPQDKSHQEMFYRERWWPATFFHRMCFLPVSWGRLELSKSQKSPRYR